MFPKSETNQELSKDIFTHYLNNLDKVEEISHGSYGIVLLLTLRDDIDIRNENNFYKQMVPNENYGKVVKKLLIKMQVVNEEKFKIKIGNYTITTVKNQDIKDEINTQTDIFFTTLNYMQPLCPSIIYADIITEYKEKMNMMGLLQKAEFVVNVNDILRTKCGIGIIVMEMINNSKPLYKYINEKEEEIPPIIQVIYDDNTDQTTKNNKEIELQTIRKQISLFKNMARYALLKLALDTGYNHNDFHMANILIQDDDTYFKDMKYSPILIDFGRTTKLNFTMFYNIKFKVLVQKDYIGALSYLCQPYNSSGLLHTYPKFSDHFGWICGHYGGMMPGYKLGESVNKEIGELFASREKSIDENVIIMRDLYNKAPNEYPLLPLSNKIKNNLYNGMIGGKKKLKQKRKTRKQKRDKRRKINKTNRK